MCLSFLYNAIYICAIYFLSNNLYYYIIILLYIIFSQHAVYQDLKLVV